MKTLAEMAAQGSSKLRAKAASMEASWTAARPRMSAGYDATPFGPTRKSNYKAGIGNATYRAPDAEKWARNWAGKMAE